MSSRIKTTATKEERPALVPKLRFPEFRGAEGWGVEFLGNICQPQQWPTISSNDLVGEGYPVYGANGFIGYYTDFNHELETVAVTCRGSTCGEVSLIPPKSYITGNSMCLDGIDSFQNSYHFVYHLLKHRGFDDIISGSAQPQIVGNAIKRLRIALASKPEQQKIAECLSSVDELMAAQARKVDALKTHKKGLMQQLFPREGETQPRLRFPEFRNAGEWQVRRLDAFAHYENGKAHENEISEDGRFIVVNSKFISTEGGVRKFSNQGFCIADEGNVLMVLSDVPNGRAIAKCYFVESDNLYTVNQRICRIQPTKVDGKFLFYILDRNAYFLDFDDGIKQTNLRKEDVLGCPLHVPPQRAEQQRIATCLSSLDALIAAETQKLEALKTHKKGLMQQLFPSPEEVAA